MRRKLSHVIKLTAEAGLLLEEIMGYATAALKRLDHDTEGEDNLPGRDENFTKE